MFPCKNFLKRNVPTSLTWKHIYCCCLERYIMRNKIMKPHHEAPYHTMKIITVFTLIITLFAFFPFAYLSLFYVRWNMYPVCCDFVLFWSYHYFRWIHVTYSSTLCLGGVVLTLKIKWSKKYLHQYRRVCPNRICMISSLAWKRFPHNPPPPPSTPTPPPTCQTTPHPPTHPLCEGTG